MNKLVQLFTTVGIISCCTLACGEKKDIPVPTDQPNKAIALKIENGTSLSYKVSPNENVNYALDITFHELSPKLSYDFVMTNMDYTKGSVEQSEKARRVARKHTNQFVKGNTANTDKTSLVLSTDVYRDLLEVGVANINWEGQDVEFKTVSNEDYTFEKGNGQVIERVIHCTNENKTKQFWVWKNPELPLIMKVKDDISLELTYWYLPGERP